MVSLSINKRENKKKLIKKPLYLHRSPLFPLIECDEVGIAPFSNLIAFSFGLYVVGSPNVHNMIDGRMRWMDK